MGDSMSSLVAQIESLTKQESLDGATSGTSNSFHLQSTSIIPPLVAASKPIGTSATRCAATMSFIVRRGLSTMVPPKIASPQGLGAAKGAARMERIVGFYEKLPKGPAPEPSGGGIFGWYQRRYFGKNPSPAPLFHVIGGLLLLGYSQEYYFHLRHHKNHAH